MYCMGKRQAITYSKITFLNQLFYGKIIWDETNLEGESMYVDLITSYIYIYEIRNRRINTSGL